MGFLYGDIVGLESAAYGLCSDQPGRRRVGKGDEFNKVALAQPAPTAPAPAAKENARMVPALPTSLPCLLSVRVQKLAQAILVRAPCSAR